MSQEEARIRKANTKICFIPPKKEVKDRVFYKNSGRRFLHFYNDVSLNDLTFDRYYPMDIQIDINNKLYADKMTEMSYMDEYIEILKHTNRASLLIIMDDHIRRGVPIDISWIPEQTLAEIEATKPVRRLKKQIKALEKQY